ncbi:MAG: A/G-specific adenine glycosylase [Bacteroidetes bacterium]|nr:A/G-specific adenine glycosylase [Bacteroidota bacterium]
MIDHAAFAQKIIRWYTEHKRPLPWRETTDPYKIWLSEIILQQTRVAQGLPYYERFVNTYPTVAKLAAAPQQNVLRLWQGLGYYSRARNLHTCAKRIVEMYRGVFPNTFNDLQKLPGVGPYTAAAIASIAFKESVAVVDGNVYRVLARVFGIEIDTASTEGKKYFFEKANQLVPAKDPDLFNQAVMEFGALHCLPQNPKCDDCIFSNTCIARKHELQNVLPIKSKKTKIKKRYFYYFNFQFKNKLLMKLRVGKDIWQGLFDFYLIEKKRATKSTGLSEENETLSSYVPSKLPVPFKHVLSHQQLFIYFIPVHLSTEKEFTKMGAKLGLKAFSKKEVEQIPKPIVVERYLKANVNSDK